MAKALRQGLSGMIITIFGSTQLKQSNTKILWVSLFVPNHVRLETSNIAQKFLTCPQVPCVTQKGSKELDLWNWLETWCRSQLPALKGVKGLCWKLRD
jgi:hypothetical protein